MPRRQRSAALRRQEKEVRRLRPGSEQTGFCRWLSRGLRGDLRPQRIYVCDRATEALHRDDVAAVANLIGYSYRKLGDYRSRRSGTSAR
jgi:hypothetical protein